MSMVSLAAGARETWTQLCADAATLLEHDAWAGMAADYFDERWHSRVRSAQTVSPDFDSLVAACAAFDTAVTV